MTLLDVAPVPQLQRRGHPNLDLRQYLQQEQAPPLALSLADGEPQPIHRCVPTLRGPKHDVNGSQRSRGVTVVEHRLLHTQSRWLRRWVDQQHVGALIERSTAMNPDARLSQHPSRFRNDYVDDRRWIFQHFP